MILVAKCIIGVSGVLDCLVMKRRLLMNTVIELFKCGLHFKSFFFCLLRPPLSWTVLRFIEL